MPAELAYSQNSNPSSVLGTTNPDGTPLQGPICTCHSCGAVFTRSSARFCSKCGAKKGSSAVKFDRHSNIVSNDFIDSSISIKEFPKNITLENGDTPKSTPTINTDPSGRPEDKAATHKANPHTVSWEASAVKKDEVLSKNSKATVKNSSPKKKIKRKKNSRGSFGQSANATDLRGGTDPISTPAEGGAASFLSETESPKLRGADFSATDDSIGYNISSTIGVSSTDEAQYNIWATLSPENLTPEMLQTPNAEMLKSWRKGNLVGRGTYGSVFLGLLPTGGFHAVKTVDISQKGCLDVLNFNAKMLVSLSREINIMRRLRHPNLCGFTGVLFDPEASSICIFMEYIGGGSLANIIRRFKPLPIPVVRSWTKQLLSGLLYLHSQNIMHRDIKADNVLVDTNSDPESETQIKLVDFGAARRLMDAFSQSHTLIGTPYWMAPEVVSMSNFDTGYSYKADVWSVGCTVAEMLTGKPPWPCQSNAPATIIMIASSKGLPTELPKDEATPGCYDFMLQCFERNPEKRPTVEKLLHHPWIRGEVD
ncbi:unnamed protein product, partial [Phytomonas sp. Hart1]